jgi:methionine-rich copper-binding protein CopC
MTQRLLLGAALAAGLICAGGAQAHPRMLSSTPSSGQPAAAPREVRIAFSEPLIAKFSGLTVKGPHGAVKTGRSAVDPANPKVLVTPLQGSLSPGRYNVAWHAVSTDTHRVAGRYAFTVK